MADDVYEFFDRCWQGKAQLKEAFWTVGVLFVLLYMALSFILIRGATPVIPIAGSPQGASALMMPVVIAGVVYWGICVWRCAPNAKQALWGYAARGVVVVKLVAVCAEAPKLYGIL